jgi:hypothetical protein
MSWQRPTAVDLDVRFRPLGTARVSIRISDEREGASRIDLWEAPSSGPVTGLRGRAFDALAHVRNALSLRRFRRLAETRAPVSAAAAL